MTIFNYKIVTVDLILKIKDNSIIKRLLLYTNLAHRIIIHISFVL